MRFLGKGDGGEGEEEAVAGVELIVVNCFLEDAGGTGVAFKKG